MHSYLVYIIAILLIFGMTQSNILDYMQNTLIGRLLFLLSVFYIGVCNPIVAFIVVLTYIVLIGLQYYSYFEGFEDKKEPKMEGIENKDDKEESKKEEIASTATDIASKSAVVDTTVSDKINPATTTKEGFDLIGLDTTLRRGKQSNSIPSVYTQGDLSMLSPFDTSSFSSYFSFL
jgi:hypothetical protein